jgi:uncharacterized protein (TIGR03118 family)
MSRFLRRTALSALALTSTLAVAQHYNVTTLVTNASDASLVNPWGLSRGSGTPWWASDNATGVATLYLGNGTKVALTVTIPAAKSGTTGSPTGTIFNGSATDFLIAPGEPARFLFATIDGLIVGWNNPPQGAVKLVTTTDGSSYTGLTSATVKGKRYLYAANFTKGRVDVYDNTFQPAHWDDEGDHSEDEGEDRGAFVDDSLPRNFVPFNVQTIGNDIVVTYALHEDGNPFETDGPGLGRVDVFSAKGRLLTRLEHGDWLNAPWGVALAPLDFGVFSHDLLIGQFAGGGDTQSSGFVAAYDLATGRFKGLLEDTSGNPLSIKGVWDISPGNTGPANFDSAGAPSGELYFAAGPNHGSGGVFGHITAAATDLIQGNDQ